MYRLLYPVNLEYAPASNYHAVNYKYVNDKIAEVETSISADIVETVEADISGLYAAIDHTHDYSTTYAAINHTHDYSTTYAAIDHTHSGYALSDHNHDSAYSAINHDHDGAYATLNHDHDSSYSAINHNHNSEYAGINHTHDQFLVATITTVSGSTITLERGKAMYKKSLSANTTIAFDTTGLTLSADEVMTFELVIAVGSTSYTVTFPNNISWLEGNAPSMSALNKSYILAFRSYDGGTSWIGSYQGSF